MIPFALRDGPPAGAFAMHCIYEVRYEAQWQSAEPSHWEYDTVKVFAGPDALEAVEKARKAALDRHRLDDNGREVHCVGFRLREVVLIAEAQL
jgi:hypothetical protein